MTIEGIVLYHYLDRMKLVKVIHIMGVSRHWSFSKESMQKMIDKGLIVQTKRGCSSKKHYLDESKKTL